MSSRDFLQSDITRDSRDQRDLHVFRATADMGRPLLARDPERHDPAGLGRSVLPAGRHCTTRRQHIWPPSPRRSFLRARLDPRLHSPASSSAHLRHASRWYNTTQYRRLQYTRHARAGHDLQDQDLLLDLHHGTCWLAANDNRAEGASGIRDDPSARPVHRRDADGLCLVQISPRIPMELVFYDRVS